MLSKKIAKNVFVLIILLNHLDVNTFDQYLLRNSQQQRN